MIKRDFSSFKRWRSRITLSAIGAASAPAPAPPKDEPIEQPKQNWVLRMLGLVKGPQAEAEVKAQRELPECPDIAIIGADG